MDWSYGSVGMDWNHGPVGMEWSHVSVVATGSFKRSITSQ